MYQQNQPSGWLARGQALTEYGLMIGAIGLVLVVSMAVLRDDMRQAIRQSLCGIGNYELSEDECVAYVRNNDELPETAEPLDTSTPEPPSTEEPATEEPPTEEPPTSPPPSEEPSEEPPTSPPPSEEPTEEATTPPPPSEEPTEEETTTPPPETEETPTEEPATEEPNNSPVARINAPDSCTANEVCNFSGSTSSDPDGDTLSYEWEAPDGSINQNGAPSAGIVFSSAGEGNIVRLTVRDGNGGSDTTEVTVGVISVNQRPSASVDGPATCKVNDPCGDFSADNSYDADGDSLTYTWSAQDGSAAFPNQANTNITFSSTGNKQVTLTVDDGNLTDTTTVSVTVETGNKPPEAVISSAPTTCTVGQTCGTFDSAGSNDPDGNDSNLGYAWSAPDASITASNGPSTTMTFNSAGQKTVTLTVTDNKNASDDATHSLTVNAPAANVWIDEVSVGGSTGKGNRYYVESLTFHVTSSNSSNASGVTIDLSGEPSCTTGSNGRCTIDVSNVELKNNDSATYTISGVSAGTDTYVSGNNTNNAGGKASINGNTVTVSN